MSDYWPVYSNNGKTRFSLATQDKEENKVMNECDSEVLKDKKRKNFFSCSFLRPIYTIRLVVLLWSCRCDEYLTNKYNFAKAI